MQKRGIETDTKRIIKDEVKKENSVKIKEKPELCEIELNDAKKAEEKKRKPALSKSIRYYVMLIVLILPFVTTYPKIIINFSVIKMIDPEYIKMESRQPAESDLPYFESDNSCPVNIYDRLRLLEELRNATSRAHTTEGERFPWDERIQGLLKAAFSIGHIPFQIPGSRLSEIFNAHQVLTGTVLATAILSFLAPFMATIHYTMLFADLFLLGVAGSLITPALITLFSHWLTPGEKSIMLTCYLIATRLGSALTSIICGWLFSANISWRYVFFSAAGANFVFMVIFFLCTSSRPVDHPLITQLEIEYLARKNTLVSESLQNYNSVELKQVEANTNIKKDKKNTHPPPWRAILTSAPVWAFVVTKFCVKLAGDTVQIELPSYLDRVMHYSADINGLINGLNYIIFCLGCLIAGGLAKVAVKKEVFGFSKTTIRKIFQCFASFGVSLLILGLAFSMCKSEETVTFLILWFFVTTFGTGGEQQIPIDITIRYSGTIHAIASTLAISGAIVPTVVGAYLKGHPADRDRWRVIWFAASAVSFFGGLTFLIFADASVQPFDSMGIQENDEESGKKKETSELEKVNQAFENESNLTKTSSNLEKNENKPYRESRQI